MARCHDNRRRRMKRRRRETLLAKHARNGRYNSMWRSSCGTWADYGRPCPRCGESFPEPSQDLIDRIWEDDTDDDLDYGDDIDHDEGEICDSCGGNIYDYGGFGLCEDCLDVEALDAETFSQFIDPR